MTFRTSAAAILLGPVRSGRLAAPATATTQYSPAVDKLNKDEAALLKTLDTTVKAAKDLDGKLAYIQGGLDIPSKIAADLKKLDTSLKAVQLLLSVAAAIPDIQTEAKAMIDGITTIDKPIVDAQKSSADFDAKIKPAKDAVKSMHHRMDQLIAATKDVEKKLTTYVTDVDTVQACLNRAPEDRTGVKKASQDKLDQLASLASQAIAKVNTLLQEAILEATSVGQTIEKDLLPVTKPIEDVEEAIAKLQASLDSIEDPLSEVGKVLKKAVGVTFPYPHPSWTHPFRMSDYPVKVSMATIIKGAGQIEAEIERALSAALYKFAKLFGIDKLVHALINDANKAVQAVTKTLHLDFKITIPGLDKTDSNLRNLTQKASSVPSTTKTDLTSISGLVKSLETSTLGSLSMCAAKAAAPVSATAPHPAAPQAAKPAAAAAPAEEKPLIWTD